MVFQVGKGFILTAMTKPSVSVVMSVYNEEAYVAAAIESILNQTFKDFEFIIIDDGSADGTADIIRTYEKTDSRIKAIRQENRGLIAVLNRGCKLSQGKYIARMDADDISLPTRFEKQFEFLEQHPEVGVVGTWTMVYKNRIFDHIWQTPKCPELIPWGLFFKTAVIHGSVMMRPHVLASAGYYRSRALYVEDYDLWARLVDRTKFANIPEALYVYNIGHGNICSIDRNKEIQFKNIVELATGPMISAQLTTPVPLETIGALRQLSMNEPLTDAGQVKPLLGLIKKLRSAYVQSRDLKAASIRKITRDAGLKLYELAAFAATRSLWTGLCIYFQALKMDIFLFSPKHLFKALALTFAARTKRKSSA
jgi:glycosyltransferase involved in cell wall biosynthesis